jgi:hypothetical protein
MSDTLRPFDDDLSDLLGAPMKPLAHPVQDIDPTQTKIFTEPCIACGGSGKWRGGWGYREVIRTCFKCNGTGKKTFKSSPEQRAKIKMASVARKAKTVEENFEYFSKQHPEIWAWFDASKNFEFAISLKAGVAKWGSLTDKQLAAAYRCAEKFNAAVARNKARKQNVPEVNMDALTAAFDKAAAKGLKTPGLRLGDFAFKRFGNEVPVWDSNKVFLGKIVNSRFYAKASVTDEQIGNLQKVVLDPAAAAVAFGRRTGNCSCCGRLLTVKESVDRGIGPICYGKYF